MSLIADLIKLVSLSGKLFAWVGGRNHVFLKQSQRVLSALSAHGLTPTRVVPLLPRGILDKPLALGDAAELKSHLSQEFINWVQQTLQLEPRWLDLSGDRPHQYVTSYKNPGSLAAWLEERQRSDSQQFRPILRIFKQDVSPLTMSSTGIFVVVLEEHFLEINGDSISRYYLLTEGSSFEHPPCVLHLFQIVMIAHHYGLILRGGVMKRRALRRLDSGKHLLPTFIDTALKKSWDVEAALWPHLSLSDQWISSIREEAKLGLKSDGLEDIVTKLNGDEDRFAAIYSRSTSAI